jgi:hypothetical protein
LSSWIHPPDLGLYPIVDGQAMRTTVCIPIRSLNPQRDELYVQYNTARKMGAAHANFWQASIEDQNDAMVSRNKTYCPTYQPWFERVIVEMHKRQGDQSYPDEAISIEVMMALMARYETALEVAKDKDKEVTALFWLSSVSILRRIGSGRAFFPSKKWPKLRRSRWLQISLPLLLLLRL